jgi:hypothetical protein
MRQVMRTGPRSRGPSELCHARCSPSYNINTRRQRDDWNGSNSATHGRSARATKSRAACSSRIAGMGFG